MVRAPPPHRRRRRGPTVQQSTIVLDPAFTIGRRRPAPVRVLRRAHGPVRLHRHLRAGPPDRRRARASAPTSPTCPRGSGSRLVRYPGGNFVSGYRWEDGVGPVEDRPARSSTSPGAASRPTRSAPTSSPTGPAGVGVEPMMAVNLGTRGVQEACRPARVLATTRDGTALSDLRAQHGHAEPARRPAVVPRQRDGRPLADGPQDRRGVRPVADGDRPGHAPGRPRPRARRLRQLQPRHADLRHLGARRARAAPTTSSTTSACTRYYEERDGDLDQLPRLRRRHGPLHRVRRSPRPTTSPPSGQPQADRPRPSTSGTSGTSTSFLGHTKLEHRADARAHRGHLLRRGRRRRREPPQHLPAAHRPRLKIACQAQLVNVIGPLRTEEAARPGAQTIFHPFAQTARLARGTSLRVEPRGARHDTAAFGEVDTVDASATRDQETGDVAVFLVNRHPTEPVVVTVDARGFTGLQVTECLRLEDDDPRRTNTAAEPRAVQLRPDPDIRVEGGCLELRLSPASWTAVALTSDP